MQMTKNILSCSIFLIILSELLVLLEEYVDEINYKWV